MKSRESVRRILVCPNAFKGSMTAVQAAQAIAEGLALGLESIPHEIACLPLADGGDGTLETLVSATNGTMHRERVRGPCGQEVEAAWGRLGGERQDTAIIEMAEAAGIRLLSPEQYDPRVTTTYGVGQLMRAALRDGCRTLLIGIGGSATNDGGAGMAQALGAHLLDQKGDELPPGGAALAHLAHIDLTDWHLGHAVQVLVACDVDNPLCGPAGASAVYGPQKGADSMAVQELDAALAHYADILEARTGRSVRTAPGAGAAGGLGAGLIAFCDAKVMSGTELALEITDFDHALEGCDLVVTGEGRLDGQTTRGKVVAGVVKRAKSRGVPVVALAGSVEAGTEAALRLEGLYAALSIVQSPLPTEQAMRDGYGLLRLCAERLGILLRLWLP